MSDSSVKELVAERQSNYGHPKQNFDCIAGMMEVYWARRAEAAPDDPFTDIDIAAFNILQKLSRIAQTPNHLDSWRDIEGYARCAIQCLEETE